MKFLLSLVLSAFPFLLLAQTQQFSDETSFLNALSSLGVTPSVENYQGCPTFPDFTLSGGNCQTFCSNSPLDFAVWGFGGGIDPFGPAVFNFNSPIRAFGTWMNGVGNNINPVTVTLSTGSETFNAVVNGPFALSCNYRFFGIITEYEFSSVTITEATNIDYISLDDTYYASIPFDIPTMSQWGLIFFLLLIMSSAMAAILSNRKRLLRESLKFNS